MRSPSATACRSRRLIESGIWRIANSAPSKGWTRANAKGSLQVRLDSGRTAAFSREAPLHLDYGYAVTSHSSQGQTADRVLVHVDTERAGEALINRRFAYVALSRSRYDAHVYTNDKAGLADALGREHSHRSAIEPALEVSAGAPALTVAASATRTIGHGIGR